MQWGKGRQPSRGEGSGTVDAFAQPLAKQLLSPRSHKTCLTCPAPLRQAAGNACTARGWGALLQAAPGGVWAPLEPLRRASGGLHSWDGELRESGNSRAGRQGWGMWQSHGSGRDLAVPWDQPPLIPLPLGKGETLQHPTPPIFGILRRDGQRAAALWTPQPRPKVAKGTGVPGWGLWVSDPQAHCPLTPCPTAHLPTTRFLITSSSSVIKALR